MKKKNCKFKIIRAKNPRPFREYNILMAHNKFGLDEAEVDENGDLTEISYDYTVFGSCCRFEYSFNPSSHPTHFCKSEAEIFIANLPESFDLSEPLRSEKFHPLFSGLLA